MDLLKSFHIIYRWLAGSKKSSTGPTERTPKPEYLIALFSNLLTERGPLGIRSQQQFLMHGMLTLQVG